MAKQWWNVEDFQRHRQNTISTTALIAKEDTIIPKMYIVVWPPFTKGGKRPGAAHRKLAIRRATSTGNASDIHERGIPPALPGKLG
jgi:hypothetical protein